MPFILKIIYFGTPHFAVPPLEKLIQAPNLNVVAVITQEDKKVGRKQLLTASPVKEHALKHGIPVLQPGTLKENQEIIDLIKGLKPDFFVVVGYGKILPQELLKIPKIAAINIHTSLLPKYRGASPTEEALLNGESETGVTIIKITDKLDAGPILLAQRYKITPEDNAETLYVKLFQMGAEHLPGLLQDYAEGYITEIPQNEANATFCHKIKKEDGLLNFENESAEHILNKIRAYTPWPGCFFMYKNLKFRIHTAEIKPQNKQKKAGDIFCPTPLELFIQTKSNILVPDIIQMEGKKAMPVQDFLRGNRGIFT